MKVKKTTKKSKAKVKVQKKGPLRKGKYNFGHLKKLDLSEVVAGSPFRQ
jgi:hypothetical protein